MSDSLRHPGRIRPRYRLAETPAGSGGIVPRAGFGAGGDHVDDLIPAYALGALDPEERDAVDRHCRACSRCARLVAEERRVVGLLPLAVPSAIPAPDVKLALFARVAQVQAHGQQVAAETAAASGRDRALLPPTLTIPSSRPAVPAPVASVSAPAAAERRSRFGWGGAVLTVPLLVALVATGAWGFQLRGQVNSQNATANFGAGESWRLEGDEGRGQLILGADEREALLWMELDKPNADGAYQLFGMNEDGEAVPLSELEELELDEQGRGEKIFPVSQSLEGFQRVQVRARADSNDGNAGEAVLSVSPNGSIGSENPSANSALP